MTEQQTSWKPIESAPDCVDVLVYRPTPCGVEIVNMVKNDGYWSWCLDAESPIQYMPTHWMPLPPPPEQ